MDITERTEVLKDEKVISSCDEPTETGTQGTQGQNGNCEPFVSIKNNIKKYYFKGKYPKPR